jgi:hypothetical protein
MKKAHRQQKSSPPSMPIMGGKRSRNRASRRPPSSIEITDDSGREMSIEVGECHVFAIRVVVNARQSILRDSTDQKDKTQPTIIVD